MLEQKTAINFEELIAKLDFFGTEEHLRLMCLTVPIVKDTIQEDQEHAKIYSNSVNDDLDFYIKKQEPSL